MLNEEIVLSIDPTAKKVQKYAKKQFLGHGGFAKCYTMINLRTGEKFAGKVIKKKQLKDKQARQKIFQQIEIHKSLSNDNICRFFDMFQFQQQIYIILELCQNNSLKQFLKSRIRITQFQAKYYLLQIINGLEYLHKLNILHRDIKLGNIFLNYKMQVKIGDFGLSTKLKSYRDRRFTTCGTPNYIAPQILNETGHGFEVDIWAVGIMLYALVVGKPPFQSDTVDNTYKRIKQNTFTFPKQIPLTIQCKTIIKNLLQPNPKYRITLQQLRNHDFLTKTRIPLSLPPYTISIPPQNSFLKQHGCNQKPMKLMIFPRKISNTYDIVDQSLQSKQQQQSNLNNINGKYNNNKQKHTKKISRVLSLDKQLFKTTRLQQQQQTTDQKSSLNRCHIYNSRNRITSMMMMNSSRNKKSYGSVQNINLGSNQNNRLIEYNNKLKEKRKQNDLCEIICYFDLQQKYGMGYLLSNGNYGVVFNDKTSLTKLEIVKQNQSHQSRDTLAQQQQSPLSSIQYIYYHKQQTKLATLPASLKKKQAILSIIYSKLKKYKQQNISVPFHSFTYVKKIVNTEQFFMLKLSNDILQFFWLTDTVVLRGQKWIKWRIGKYDGQSVISNPSLPLQVKAKLDEIKKFLAKSANRGGKRG